MGDFDEDHMPMATVAGIAGWDWWDSISWDQLLKMPSITSPLIPRGVRHAVATFKGKICFAIEEGLVKNDAAGETRAWKGLFAIDALLYNESHQDRKTKSRTALIAEKLSLMEEGHWGTVWAQMQDIEKPMNNDGSDPDERTVKRIESLMDAGEGSRATAAVWGGGKLVSSTEVIDKFMTTHKGSVDKIRKRRKVGPIITQPHTPHRDGDRATGPQLAPPNRDGSQ